MTSTAIGVRTGLVIVNHNTKDDLIACLETAQDAGATATVVVDCGSTDGSVQAAEAAFPDITVLALPNLGFGRGANAGVEAILKRDPKISATVIANADTRFYADGITTLGQFLATRPDVGAAGPRVRYPDGRIQLSARAFPDIPTALGHALLGLVKPDNPWTRKYRLTDWDHNSEREVDWLSGCCLAVNHEAFSAIGGFDPAYFMFVEDVDLCWRLGQAGWKVVFTPVAEVTHAVGASVSGRRTKMVVEHAKSLDRFFGRRYQPNVITKWLIRGGLMAWALSVIGWSALRGRTHGQGAS